MQGTIVWKHIFWEVIHGKKLGRTLWFPTANISFRDDGLESWVYASNTFIDWKLYASVSVYTWEGTSFWKKYLLETYIFDFSEDIYEQELEVILLEKIRDNKKFDDLESLKFQLECDTQTSRELRFPVLTFGSFDILHEGHHYYLSEAKKYARQLITILARDITIERVKWKAPYYGELTRKKYLEASWLSDKVELWVLENPFIWLEKYRPKIIVLGYDQRGKFVDELPAKLKELWLSQTLILRTESLEPERYKSSKLREALKK